MRMTWGMRSISTPEPDPHATHKSKSKGTSVPALVRSEPDCSTSLDGFFDRMEQTVAWCGDRSDAADPKGCLRDDYLRPRSLERCYLAAVSHVTCWREAKLGGNWTR